MNLNIRDIFYIASKSIEDSLSDISLNILLGISCTVILTIFIRAIIYLFFNTHKILKDVRKANALFCSTVLFQNNPMAAFYQRYENIDKSLSNLNFFSHGWNEFKKQLVKPGKKTDFQHEPSQLRIKNFIQPDFFFNEENFIEKNIDMKSLDSIPGILTGMGILGTFLGLSIGIASVELDNPYLMTQSIKRLLSGAGLAFVSSLLGLSLSIFFSLIEKVRIREVERGLNEFVHNLERSLEFVTSMRGNIEIRESIKEQNKKLNDLIALSHENTRGNNLIFSSFKEIIDKQKEMTSKNSTNREISSKRIVRKEKNESL